MPAALAEAFSGHARFVAEVLALPAAVAEQHQADTLTRAAHWLAAGTPSVQSDEALTTQVAALLRLES